MKSGHGHSYRPGRPRQRRPRIQALPADWPAAILALDAQLEIAGPSGRRAVKASDFFVEMMQSAVQPNEILVEIRVPLAR